MIGLIYVKNLNSNGKYQKMKKKKKKMWTCLVYVKNSKYPIVNIKNEKRKKKFLSTFSGSRSSFLYFKT